MDGEEAMTLSRAIILLCCAQLTGCAATAPAIIAAVASGATAAHDLLQLPGDVLAAVSASCQLFSGARAARPSQGVALDPWYGPICNDVSPSNPAINARAATWIAEGVGKMEALP